MATIRTAIALYDGVTGPLRSIQHAINNTMSAFESLNQASGNPIDTAALRQAQTELNDVFTDFERTRESIDRSEQAQARLNRSIQAGTTAADGLWASFRRIGTTIGGLAAVKKVIGLSDELAGTKARLSLIVDDGGSVEELERKIMASAQRSRAAYFDTASAVASMGANAKAAFGNSDELIAFLEQVNKQFAIGGANAQGQAAAMLQLTQAMGMGVLRGEELNSILENAPGIARIIEQHMGIAEDSIKSYAEEGKVTAQVVKNALLNAADETNQKFESMPMTWSQIWTSMENKALSIFSPILQKINELANTSRFSTVTDGVLGGLAATARAGTVLLDILLNIGSVFVDNWSLFQPIILGIAAAMLLYNGYLLANNILTGINNAQKGLAAVQAYRAAAANTTLAASEQAQAMATASATAAQYGFNAALLASPIAWAVSLIIAFITALYLGVAAFNKFMGTAVSATGIIAGAFATLGAFLINSFIVPVQNQFASFVNFIGNAFNDPLAAVEVAFYDMCLSVLGYISTLADAIETVLNKIPGVTVDITSGLDNFYSGIEEAQKKVKNKSGWVEYVKAMDFIDYSDAASAGYDFGKGIEDKISGIFDGSDIDPLGAFDFTNTLDGIYGNTGDTAANTAESAKKLDITSEELKYLRDIAEREAINRFTTAEIHIDQTNHNNIAGGMDVDGIMDSWTEWFAEKLDISYEGVHP